jgi:hypothetical protein
VVNVLWEETGVVTELMAGGMGEKTRTVNERGWLGHAECVMGAWDWHH